MRFRSKYNYCANGVILPATYRKRAHKNREPGLGPDPRSVLAWREGFIDNSRLKARQKQLKRSDYQHYVTHAIRFDATSGKLVCIVPA